MTTLFDPAAPRQRIEQLHPEVEIAREKLAVAMHLLAAVPCREFGPAVGSLADRWPEFMDALDLLFAGIRQAGRQPASPLPRVVAKAPGSSWSSAT
jgi:hypothetical protein